MICFEIFTAKKQFHQSRLFSFRADKKSDLAVFKYITRIKTEYVIVCVDEQRVSAFEWILIA